MKVCLLALNASYVHTNLAVRCLAQALSLRGHDAVIVERSLKDRDRDILSALYEHAADVYGFSVYIWNRDAMLSLAARLHVLLPGSRIVFGGPEISAEDASFFSRYPFVDNILAGEGEETLPDYCDAFPPRHTVLCGTPYRGFTEAGILYDKYPPGGHTGGILYYESSRGCPFGCTYCLSSATHGVRAKSAAVTVAEMRQLDKLPGVRVIKLVDRTFNFDRRRAAAIWHALAEGEWQSTFHFEICAELLDEDAFSILSRMPRGRMRLECGVQSTNPATLSAVGRKTDTSATLRALARLKQMGNIHIHADLIAGLPEESYARFAQSFDGVYPVADVLQLGFLKLLPGTSLRTDAARYGIRYAPVPPYEVLGSDAISYPELCRLHRIDDVLDRFGSSGHFAHALAVLMQSERSPFRFWESLADALGNVRSLSQRRAFSLFCDFALSRIPDSERETLLNALTLDWYLHEAGNPPLPCHAEILPDAQSRRRAYCLSHPGTPDSAVSAVRIGGVAYLIDRQCGRAEQIDES